MFERTHDYVTRLNQLGAILTGLGFLIMTGLVAVDVIMRRIFNAPLIFADEVAGYLLVIITLLCLAYTLQKEGHIQVKVLVRFIPSKYLTYLNILWCLIGIGYTVVLLITTFQLAIESYQLNAFSTTSQLPLVHFQIFCPIGCCLLLFQLIVRLIDSVRAVLTKRSEPRKNSS
jgi:TRAP-type C4-dicarboxylate transport system permease small subunit